MLASIVWNSIILAPQTAKILDHRRRTGNGILLIRGFRFPLPVFAIVAHHIIYQYNPEVLRELHTINISIGTGNGFYSVNRSLNCVLQLKFSSAFRVELFARAIERMKRFYESHILLRNLPNGFIYLAAWERILHRISKQKFDELKCFSKHKLL